MKTVFFDIDGTLVDIMRGLDEPSPVTVKAFRELKKEHRAIIASGRSYGMLPKSILDLEPSGLLLMNGSCFLLDGKELFSYSVEEEDVHAVIDFFSDHEGVYFLETANEVIFTNEAGTKKLYKLLEGFEDHSIYLPPERFTNEKICMISVYFEKWETGKEFEDLFKERFDITLQFPDLPYYDCNVPGINKATGIRHYLEMEGLDIKDSYAFGDSVNDLQMMEEVGTSVAMGNALKEVKDRADLLTEDVLEDGVTRALIRLGLIDMDIQEEL